MKNSSRVDALMALYDALTEDEQAMFRDLVDLAYRRLLTERLAKSVPFAVTA